MSNFFFLNLLSQYVSSVSYLSLLSQFVISVCYPNLLSQFVISVIPEGGGGQGLCRPSVVVNVCHGRDRVLHLVVHDGIDEHSHRVLCQNLESNHSQSSINHKSSISWPLEVGRRSSELSCQWPRIHPHKGWWKRLLAHGHLFEIFFWNIFWNIFSTPPLRILPSLNMTVLSYSCTTLITRQSEKGRVTMTMTREARTRSLVQTPGASSQPPRGS